MEEPVTFIRNLSKNDCTSADLVSDGNGRLLYRKTFLWPARNLAAREIAAAAVIGQHKFINELLHYDIMQSEKERTFVLFYPFADNLCEYLKFRKSASHSWIVQFFKSIIVGLIHMQAHNVMHRKICAENILISNTDTVQVGNLSHCEWICETRLASSLDAALVKTDKNAKIDTFALGVLLYEMLTERHAFQELSENIETSEFEFPRWMTKDLVSLLNGMLHHDPSSRISLDEILRHRWLNC